MACGTVWSLPPAVISSGPRVLFRVLTLAGEFGVKFAKAASNRVLPGDPFGLAAGFLDRVGFARPSGRQRRVTRLAEQVHPRIPRGCVQPQAVNEHNMTICWAHLCCPFILGGGHLSGRLAPTIGFTPFLPTCTSSPRSRPAG